MRHGLAGRVMAVVSVCAALSTAFWGAGCSRDGAQSSAAPAGVVTTRANAAGDDAASAVLSTEPWSFMERDGRVIRTRHYRLFTTETNSVLRDRLASFLEAALVHYRRALTPLPGPPQKLDTYLMDNRPQWQAVATKLMGARAEPLMQIERGGFASRGIGVYYDLGLYDTLAIAAHEGWHQYTQRTFPDQLPIWLEEGMATFMEGHRFADGAPVFLPWANIERFDHLREVVGRGKVMPLRLIMDSRPGDFVAAGSVGEHTILSFYAHVWALTHFLNEGEGGRHAGALRRVLADAATGAMRERLRVSLGAAEASRARAERTGPAVFETYFGGTAENTDAAFRAFVERLTGTGARERIAAGRSPFAAGSP